MNLTKKKILAAKVLNVGKNRIIFVAGHETEIKEAITRQDIRDLYNSKTIQIKDISGRRKITKRKHRRRTGKVKKTVNKRKQNYVKLTRKLRKFAGHLLKTGKIDKERHGVLRKRIKAGKLKSKRHLNESFKEI